MKQKLTKLFLMLVVMMLASIDAHAQKTMDVSKFSRLDNDLMARVTKPVRDQDEGKLCALVRVVTNLSDLQFRADALGIVKQESHTGEYWLYVPYGARSLSFTCQGYYPLVYQYSLPIEEGTVYELRLGSYETALDGNNQNLNTQMFVLTHQPDDATVYIDGIEVPSEYGVFAAMMSRGEHTYKVEAAKYEEQEGSFTLGDQPVRETANLHPLFGKFQLQTYPETGFNVSVNDRLVGKSPYQSEPLAPGSYRIRIEKDKYYPKDTVIRLREADDIQVSCTATSFADSLFYNRILGGRNISFGISAGYVMPFPTSSSGGGFTGSAVNYSLGDSREDVSYSAQSGFTVGLFADIRLYKNFYLTPAVNFTYYKYKNTFTQSFDERVSRTTQDQVFYANYYNNNYEERYTHTMLEVPILLSYRFVLTKTGSLHVNAGPYFSFGLSSKIDFSGSSEFGGNIYHKNYDNTIDYSQSVGTFSSSVHVSGDFNMYKKKQAFTRTYETSSSLGYSYDMEEYFDRAPFKRFNYGLKFGVAYELRGFQLGINYSLQLSNMANSEFWESTRIPLFTQTGENVMSGYKHRLHALEIKLGYVLRY